MKKLITLILVAIMCLSLVACGGPDKQPAIDAFNKASTSFNEVAAVINQDPSAYPQELIDVMVDMANLLNEHQALLQGDTEITQESLDEMIEWYGTVEQWVADAKTELGIQ